MKRIILTLLLVLSLPALCASGAVLLIPENIFLISISSVPFINNEAENIMEFRKNLLKKIDYILVAENKGWLNIWGFSLTHSTPKVIIDLKKIQNQPKNETQDQQSEKLSNQLIENTKPEKTILKSPLPLVPTNIISEEIKPANGGPLKPLANKILKSKGKKNKTKFNTNYQLNSKPKIKKKKSNAKLKIATMSSSTPAPKSVPTKEVKIITPPPPAPKTGDGKKEHKEGLNFYKENKFKLAQKSFLQAAGKGHASAQYNLGIMSYLGRGIEQDFIKAAEWFRMAADQDHALAQYNLGFLYYEGKGLKKDDLQAFMWIDRAATQGDKKAIKALATLEKVLPKDIFKNNN